MGAGWYNGYPTNLQSVSAFGGGYDNISGYAVMIGQFVWAGEVYFSFEAQVGANSGAGTEVNFGAGSISFPLPAPSHSSDWVASARDVDVDKFRI